MSDADLLQKNLQQQTTIETEKVLTAEPQFRTLETWNAPTEHMEEARDAFAQEMQQAYVSVSKFLGKETKTVIPATVAEGTPVQQEAPAKLSTKQKISRHFKRKKGKKIHPNGDENTPGIMAGLDAFRTKQDTLDRDIINPSADEGVSDVRVLRAFSYAYNVNKEGNPATPQDAEYKDFNTKFVKAYRSGNQRARASYVNNAVARFMAHKVDARCINAEYLAAHAEELREITDQSTYMDNLMKDNPETFETMNPVAFARLDAKIREVNMLGGALLNIAKLKGCDMNTATVAEPYVDVQEEQEQLGYHIEDYHKQVQASKDIIAEGASKRVTQLYDNERVMTDQDFEEYNQMQNDFKMETVEADRAQLEELRKKEDVTADEIAKQEKIIKQGLDLIRARDIAYTTHQSDYANETLVNLQHLMEKSPEIYAANKSVMDKMYQDAFRCADIKGEVVYEGRIYDNVDSDLLRRRVNDPSMYTLLHAEVMKRSDHYKARGDAAELRMGQITDYMRHLVDGRPLPPASEYMKDIYK